MLYESMNVAERNRDEDRYQLSDNFDLLLKAVADHRDKSAFSAIFSHFAPRVKSFLMKQGASEHEAEDIMQETMVKVWQKSAQFNPEKARPGTWIFTISRNCRIDRLRKQARVNYDPEDPALIPEETEAADVFVHKQQNKERIEKALSGLSEDQSKVIKMSFYSDLSHTEISEKLNIPIGTVKSRIRLAIRKIKTALEDA